MSRAEMGTVLTAESDRGLEISAALPAALPCDLRGGATLPA